MEAAADMPLLDIDPGRISEVLGNLLANALQYTPGGGKIRVRCAAEGGRGGPVTISVGDTGEGIPPGDLPHVFDRFCRSRESRGMGLGLATAKNLVAAHGGEMLAQSEPGQGTTIRLTLPS